MPIYLDHNATTPIRPEARDAMLKAMAVGGNPSAVHCSGRAARTMLENARADIARGVKARAQDVVFTSGGTEANNLAIEGAVSTGEIRRIVTSATEHDAVSRCAESTGLPVDLIPVTPQGLADLDWLKDRLANWNTATDGRPFVCLQAVTSETGVIQPVSEAGAMIREAGGIYHIDAVQALGKTGFDFAASGAHYAAISAHKIGGPQGCGALILACDAPFDVPRKGGGQEKGRRSGTENVAGAYGFAAALKAMTDSGDGCERLAALRDRIEAEVLAAVPCACVIGSEAPRTANTTAIATPGWDGGMQVIALDLSGVCVSAGSACTSGKAGVSRAWSAIVGEDLARCAIRVSLGWTTTEAEVDAFIKTWTDEYARVAPRLKELA
ncbi:cysteine desulfurase family protein [Hyphobacterium marinum]|uniref:Cysteine desulfurase n=1 Tax=Hyphobacterium marinum TaxID=3116574 RepID=A0ABU7M0D2_9PROT|nr:cysteine desulfurase family protein [Hyphobacterium sp. Y6023]MEE2567269.1 cysteine desulfurase family protein [Hyphobacterium sp. Y6023]